MSTFFIVVNLECAVPCGLKDLEHYHSFFPEFENRAMQTTPIHDFPMLSGSATVFQSTCGVLSLNELKVIFLTPFSHEHVAPSHTKAGSSFTTAVAYVASYLENADPNKPLPMLTSTWLTTEGVKRCHEVFVNIAMIHKAFGIPQNTRFEVADSTKNDVWYTYYFDKEVIKKHVATFLSVGNTTVVKSDGVNWTAEHKHKLYYSDRSNPLIATQVLDVPIVTLENYEKWYCIYLLHPDGTVTKVPLQIIEKVNNNPKRALWVDHRYHPELLLRIAKEIGGVADLVTLEIAAGRWVMEADGYEGFFYFLDEDAE